MGKDKNKFKEVAKETKVKKKEYKVISSSLGGKNNKIFEYGDIVTQEMLNGSAEEFIEKGFLKLKDGS